MGSKKYLFLYLFLLNTLSVFGQNKNIEIIKNATWDEEEIAKGILWKHKHFFFLFNGKQYINIIEINLNDSEYKVELAYEEKEFIRTSEFAKRRNAILAVNGSFFNIEKGGGVCFLKVNDKIINDTKTKDSIWYYNDEAALSIDLDKIGITYKKDSSSWQAVSIKNILSTGPILVKKKKLCVWEKYDLSHARTALGIKGNKLILLTIDGKNFQSKGVTINELAILMYTLGCENAINLDGGHSSTMWIKGKNIVNHPSANQAFDHDGEKKVANAILILKKD